MKPTPAAPTGNPDLIAAIHDRIRTSAGRVTFAEFMAMALYHPAYGYYLAPTRRPGRGGDFLTSPEATAYFGITLARQIAECWERLGRPRRWAIREYGPGMGVLAYDVIAGLSDLLPEAVSGLQYRLVEPNSHRLAEALTAMAEAGLEHIVIPEPVTDDAADLDPITGIVLANEVADAQPVHRLIVRDGRLCERYVISLDGGFSEEIGDLSPPVQQLPGYFSAEGIDLPEGAQVDVSPAAGSWFVGACRGLERGYAITIDYGYPARSLFTKHRLAGTLRGYAAHTVTDDPFTLIGEQDLTAHVDFTALVQDGERSGMTLAGFTTQGAMLASLGLGDFLVELRQDPAATMADYATAQAVVLRLIDPGGLGRFGVLIMAKDAPVTPPLRSFATPPPPF